MHDAHTRRIQFLMRHQGLSEQQASEQVQAEQHGQPADLPADEQILIVFHPFHERPTNVAEAIGHRPAVWEAVWTAATQAGAPDMAHMLGRFESESETEAIAWAQERCPNVWIRPVGHSAAITVEDYLSRS